MAGRGSQLPRVKPVGRAVVNPPHTHRDGDLAYIMDNWPKAASAAWAGYLARGRGLTIVDTHKTYPVPTGLGHAISYLPANLVTAADDACMVREYDPEREVVGMLRANGDEDIYRLDDCRQGMMSAVFDRPASELRQHCERSWLSPISCSRLTAMKVPTLSSRRAPIVYPDRKLG